ncbi:hypothetical protein PsorP6_017415 [Peronosclerospora sorghi]|uniref:Uncharacterized protein n=1 Tax=Peronosclerospora sorghi TaxID=230839 RepID=A0ACC0WLS9_9STRA|nr:hypothetical protein PsorP6_017415 [Peronosclerospora sorghi]
MRTECSRIQLVLVIAVIAYITRVFGHSPLSAELDPPVSNTSVVARGTAPRKLRVQPGGTVERVVRAAGFEEIKLPPALKKLKSSDELLAHPDFQRWTTSFTSRIKSNVDQKMANFLRKNLDDAVLARMVLSASKNQQTQSLARNLEKQLLKSWRKKLPETVFDDLRLHDEVGELLENPVFKMWVASVDNSRGDANVTIVKLLNGRNGEATTAARGGDAKRKFYDKLDEIRKSYGIKSDSAL